jgi:hypothetical protein
MDLTMTPVPIPLHLDERAIVGRLRVRSATRLDANTTRARLERVLANDALRVPGLPPSAILCVRTLPDPSPGRVRLDDHAVVSTTWHEALQQVLAREVRSAARPIHGGVPAGATAVLFQDRAELLACLARDWTRREIGAWWWWRHLVRGPAVTSRLGPAQWLEEPRHVPSAARMLAHRGALVAFAAALEEDEARALVARVAESFGIDLSALPAAGGSPSDWPHVSAEASSAPRLSSGATWRQWAPEAASPEIEAPARALIMLSLVLARAPSLARDRDTIATVQAWLAEGSESRALLAASTEGLSERIRRKATALQETTELASDSALSLPSHGPAPAEQESPPPPAPWFESQRARDATVVPPILSGEGQTETAVDRPTTVAIATTPSSEMASPSPRDLLGPMAPEMARSVAVPIVRVRAPAGIDSARGRTALSAQPSPSPREPTGDDRLGDLELLIATRYGGAFFLINALLALEVYGDFTRPRSRLVHVSPWRLVAELARTLLGDARDASDEIWPLLDELAGPLGESEVWPIAWRVNPAWLAPFAEREGWTWHRADGRLRVEHPAGFVVIDVPCEGDVGAQRSREIAPYGVDAAGVSGWTRTPTTWLDALAGFLRVRIHRALGARDPDASVRLLVCLPARVRASETRVDVRFALAELPIEIRLAGLDRDPGWVPAAGRFVAIHFE